MNCYIYIYYSQLPLYHKNNVSENFVTQWEKRYNKGFFLKRPTYFCKKKLAISHFSLYHKTFWHIIFNDATRVNCIKKDWWKTKFFHHPVYYYTNVRCYILKLSSNLEMWFEERLLTSHFYLVVYVYFLFIYPYLVEVG